MSLPQTTPFSLFLYDIINTIREPFMSPDKVIKFAEEIWNDMPHELKFSYFKKAHDQLVEQFQNNRLSQTSCETEDYTRNE
jgi:hypothetical protein